VDAAVTFRPETVKELTYRLGLAWRAGRQWLIKQLSALLMLADRQEVYAITSRLGGSRSCSKPYCWQGDSSAYQNVVAKSGAVLFWPRPPAQ
jgi:hypothetical protein